MIVSEVTSAMRPFQPYGAALDLLYSHEPEDGLSGPAGTGKSRTCLEKLHACAEKYPGMRALIVRKTRASLTESALVTFEEKVVPERHPILTRVQRRMRQAYHYPNGSEIVVGGIDNASRVMSTEYDLIYVQEATELTEDEWEKLTTRLRSGVMPYQQIVFDCNPDAPTHWLRQRANRGVTKMRESRHEDNPTLWDHVANVWTAVGKAYIAVLDALTGVRKARLRFGIWAAAEGMVYENWDSAMHLIDRVPVPDDMPPEKLDARGVPLDWPRYWVVDFGYTNPFVWQEWAEDDDGRLYRLREIYRTQGLVEDHAKDIRRITEHSPDPHALICDHDAEGRATLERHLGRTTTGAHKAVTEGIQAVSARLRPAGDGRPRLFLLRDALVDRDAALADKRKPCCTEEEIDGYVWDLASNRKKGEEPLKENDHGCDALRYMTAHRDLIGDISYAPFSLFG